MRTKELDVIHSVANRIAHFEQKQTSDGSDSSVNTSVMMNNCNQKHKSHRLTPSSFGQRYLDLDDIMEEESSIEDEEERSQGDSDTGYIAGSNEETSSPDTSFRLSGRSSSSSSDHSGDIGGEVRETEEENTDNNKGHKAGISEKLSQKSLDSGFSDFSDSRDTREGGEAREAKRREMKSSVVHETHATKDAKLHHVSKVYFYSVSDLLTQQRDSTEFEDHLTLLKNESNTSSSSSGHSNPTTPRISSSVCDEDFFDRVESPFIPITSPSSQISTVSRDSPLQRCPRVHTGTSSLRRKATAPASAEDTEAKTSWTESPSESPVRRCLTPSQSPFPITNGSLYSDLSLTRRNKETQKRKSKSKSDLATSSFEADNQNNNNNPPESPYQSLNGSLPLESYGLNVSSSR